MMINGQLGDLDGFRGCLFWDIPVSGTACESFSHSVRLWKRLAPTEVEELMEILKVPFSPDKDIVPSDSKARVQEHGKLADSNNDKNEWSVLSQLLPRPF